MIKSTNKILNPLLQIENESINFRMGFFKAILVFGLWEIWNTIFSLSISNSFNKSFLLNNYYIIGILQLLSIPIIIIIFSNTFGKLTWTKNSYNKIKSNNILFLALSIIAFRLIYDAYISPIVSLIPLGEVLTNFQNTVKMSPSFLITTFITSITYAPIVEEIICRGIVLSGLLKKFSPGLSIFISSLLFAIMHGNIHQGINAFLLALFLGYIYYRTKSIFLCIFTHFFNNAFVFLSTVPQSIISMLIKDPVLLLIVNVFLYTALCIPILIYLYRNFKFHYEENFIPITNKKIYFYNDKIQSK